MRKKVKDSQSERKKNTDIFKEDAVYPQGHV